MKGKTAKIKEQKYPDYHHRMSMLHVVILSSSHNWISKWHRTKKKKTKQKFYYTSTRRTVILIILDKLVPIVFLSLPSHSSTNKHENVVK